MATVKLSPLPLLNAEGVEPLTPFPTLIVLESTVLASSDFLVPLKGTSSAQPRAENHSFISGSALSLSLHIQSVSSEYFVLKSPEMFSPFPFMLLYYCCILSPGLLFFLTIFIP